MEKEEIISRALSAGTRRRILRLLSEKELNVKDISEKTGMSMSLTSRHLTFLSDLGLLNVRKESPFKFYSIKLKDVKELLVLYDRVIGKL